MADGNSSNNNNNSNNNNYNSFLTNSTGNNNNNNESNNENILNNAEIVKPVYPSFGPNSQSSYSSAISSTHSAPPVVIPNPVLSDVYNNCLVKSLIATVFGFGAGFLFGSFFGMNTMPTTAEVTSKPALRQVADSFKQAGRSGYSLAKGFSVAGACFTGSECLFEQWRAKSDHWNGLAAGCLSGAVLGARGGYQASAFGCASFAAFSAAIDHFTGRYDTQYEAKHDDKISFK